MKQAHALRNVKRKASHTNRKIGHGDYKVRHVGCAAHNTRLTLSVVDLPQKESILEPQTGGLHHILWSVKALNVLPYGAIANNAWREDEAHKKTATLRKETLQYSSQPRAYGLLPTPMCLPRIIMDVFFFKLILGRRWCFRIADHNNIEGNCIVGK